MAKLSLKPKRRQKEEPIEDEKPTKRHQAPGRTIESRESQLINKAYDLVEQRIDRGTATSQETTHFLRVGSAIAQLEKIKLEKENELLVAKTEALASQKRIEELYAQAMKSFGIYRGEDPNNDSDDSED